MTRGLLLSCMLWLTAGCGEHVTYHYTLAVETPHVFPPPGAPMGVGEFEPDAKVTVRWKGGVRQQSISVMDGAVTIKCTEQQSSPLSPIAHLPQGLRVRVTKEGYKPWDAEYGGAYAFVRDGRHSLRRIDVLLMQPLDSPQPTALTASAP